ERRRRSGRRALGCAARRSPRPIAEDVTALPLPEVTIAPTPRNGSLELESEVVAADRMLRGEFESAREFLREAYARYGEDRPGLFLASDVVDVPLGVALPLEIVFRSPATVFRVHGKVIWRRRRQGTDSKSGRVLPKGLAIEL